MRYFQCAIFQKSSLKKAARAGALCTVVRLEDWKPEPGDELRNLKYLPQMTQAPSTEHGDQPREVGVAQDSQNLAGGLSDNPIPHPDSGPVRLKVARLAHPCFQSPIGSLNFRSGVRQVQGNCKLPKGYALAMLPPRVDVTKLLSTDPTSNINYSYSLSTGLIAAFQTIYASVTLYLSQGDQL